MSLWHRHRFAVVDVSHGRSVYVSPNAKQYGGDVTEVLERCPCGTLRTQRIDGHWTREQIGGSP